MLELKFYIFRINEADTVYLIYPKGEMPNADKTIWASSLTV